MATTCGSNGITYVSLIDPQDFTRWVFPRLFRARIPRYETIAAAQGYTVTTDELSQVENEQDFLELLERVIEPESPDMPLVAHTELPTFKRLRAEGQNVLTPERATHQAIRELHVGLLNMMPDAAIEATERQFFRLVGEANPIAQFFVHPFTLKELPRGEKARPTSMPIMRRSSRSRRMAWMR